MGTYEAWPVRFEAELVRLGVPEVRARRLTEDTAAQAAETAADPAGLFGPAHLYARHLVTELAAPVGAAPPRDGS